jgi:hypothetical protein
MTDLPPTLAALFTTLLGTADANTRAALISALQNHSPPIATNTTETPPSPPSVDNTTTPHNTNNTITTGSTTSINNMDGDDPEDNFILSQSDVVPRPSNPSITSSKHIQSSSGIITTLLEEQRATRTEDIQLQTRRATDGRVYNYHDAHKRKHVVIKIAMPTTANSDQAPTTLTLEEVLDVIITSLSLSFPIDIVAILNYAQPIDNVKRTSSTYYSFALLSPHSTQTSNNNYFTLEYSYLYTRLTDLLKGPNQDLRNIPNLPPITKFLTITTPHINTINERLEFLIEGVGPRTLLGPEEYENSDTFRHLGFLIFFALRTCWKQNMPPTRPFPPDLANIMTRYDIMHVISTKKVRIRTPENTPKIHNMLGVILTTTEPHATTIRDALHELCITQQHPLLIFGLHNTFSIHLHTFPNNDTTRFTLGKTINTTNHQLHLPSQFKIIRNIRIHPKFLRQHKNITQATLSLNHCIALFCDFSCGHGNLHLTAIFTADRTTSFLNPDTITSLIVDHLSHVLDLKPSPLTESTTSPSTPSPTRQSYATATYTFHNPGPSFPKLKSPPRTGGRGRGRQPDTETYVNARNQVTIPDRSPGHLRAPTNNILHLNLTPSKRFHALINAAGGIATAGVYNLDFDNGGLQHLTAGVSFAIYQAFDTWEQAFAHVCHFYPHIKLKTDITDMNTNCCHNTSNLNNPSPAISHYVGPYPSSSNHHKECFYFDDLPPNIQNPRLAATARRVAQGRFITDSYTFNNTEITHPDIEVMFEDSSMKTGGPSNPPMHINVQLPIDQLPIDPQNPPHHDDMISINDTHSSNSSNDLLSHNTDKSHNNEHSQTQQLSQNSDNPSPHKRRHTSTHNPTPPHYIKFSIPISCNIPDITTTLLNELNSTDLTPEYISHQFYHDAPAYPPLLDQKLIFIEILQPLHRPTNSTLINAITTCWPDSFPIHTNTPPTKHHPADICLKPIPTTNWARYCQVSTCTMYNNGRPFVPNTDEGFQSIQSHTQQLHSDIFIDLPNTTLNSIGWFRCCNNCHNFFLGTTNLTQHQQTCPEFQQQTQIHDFSNNPTWALAFAICPKTHTDNLNKLINDSPDDILPENLLPSLIMTVSHWCLDAKPPSHETTTATSHTHND